MERQYDIRKIFQMLSSVTQVIFIMRKDAAMACMLLQFFRLYVQTRLCKMKSFGSDDGDNSYQR